jgi:hypothetical protein
LTPFLLLGFFRLFWLIFGFIYGGLCIWILGARYAGAILLASLITALLFTGIVYRLVYLQFKIHIVGEKTKT